MYLNFSTKINKLIGQEISKDKPLSILSNRLDIKRENVTNPV